MEAFIICLLPITKKYHELLMTNSSSLDLSSKTVFPVNISADLVHAFPGLAGSCDNSSTSNVFWTCIPEPRLPGGEIISKSGWLCVVFAVRDATVGCENCANNVGKYFEASGRREESEAQINAVPTSKSHIKVSREYIYPIEETYQ